jgi:putative transport protein
MINLLRESPLLLLFLVGALGSLLGQLRVRGFGLGVAAVLFVGLAAGSLHPDLKLPEIIYVFGLLLFVYTVGLSSGPGFFASFRRRGLRDNGLVLGVLIAAATIVFVLARIFHLSGARAAGLFAGSLTNTPALAGVLESIKGHSANATEAQLAEPVVAYSLTYPVGVVGVLAGIILFRRLFRVDYDAEPMSRSDARMLARALENATMRIRIAGLDRDSAIERARKLGRHILFGRMKRGDVVSIVDETTRFEVGDLVTVVGSAIDVRAVIELLGEPCEEHLDLDRRVLDFRRMFVSQRAITEVPLGSLRLPQRFGALITRVRRGDAELLPESDTQLELGDRVRVVAPRERMADVAKLLGDSYKSISEIDVLTFGVGIALGLLLGSIPIPLPGGATFKLGFAGGPLIVGLILGRLGRTGPVVWTLPYSANLTLRQLGLVLFLAGVGTRSGWAFASTVREGLPLVALGALVTCAATILLLLVGHRALRIPLSVLIGVLSGAQTQPAALAFASEQTNNDLPSVGYATVFPLATIAKIILAQVLLMLLR